jgi:hypothetical protein
MLWVVSRDVGWRYGDVGSGTGTGTDRSCVGWWWKEMEGMEGEGGEREEEMRLGEEEGRREVRNTTI